MKTNHSPTCKRVFKNYDLTCARCVELSEGASPRKGWGNLERQANIMAAIRAHNCKTSRCGPVCTAFEW